jgi:hypothetical protein
MNDIAKTCVASFGETPGIGLVGLAKEVAIGPLLVPLKLLAIEVGLPNDCCPVPSSAKNPWQRLSV